MSHRQFTLDEVSSDRPLTTTTETLEVLFGWRTAPPEKLVERIEGQYRWVDRHDDAGWLAVGLLFVAAIALASSDVVSGRGTTVVWLVWALGGRLVAVRPLHATRNGPDRLRRAVVASAGPDTPQRPRRRRAAGRGVRVDGVRDRRARHGRSVA